MVMIRLAQLVLDDHRVAGGIFRDEVDAEGASCLFALWVRQRETYGITEDVDVLFEPLRKIMCLMLPHVSEWYARDLADHGTPISPHTPGSHCR
jgi:hypothetical protein